MSDEIILGGHKFSTLVAITEDEHIKGLMHKAWPPPVMIFPYETAEVRKFWMKNTPSPLDIIFCNDNKIISINNGEPLSTKLIGPNEPSDLVVEVPLGTVNKLGIKIGDPVKINYSIYTIAKKYEKKYLTA